MTQNFGDVSILVDGLDECGKAKVIVVKLLASLNQKTLNIRTLSLSRIEQHIKDVLTDYPKISIAARSSDLKLYVA